MTLLSCRVALDQLVESPSLVQLTDVGPNPERDES